MRSWEDLRRTAVGPFLVIGLGESRELTPALIARGGFSIGCNEAQAVTSHGFRRLDYGLSFDRWEPAGGATCPFSPARLNALRRSRPRRVYFHSVPDSIPWPEFLPFICPVGYQSPQGTLRLAELAKGLLPNGWSSVVGAIAAAYWLGATTIGVVGLDLTDRAHKLQPHRAELSTFLGRHEAIYRAAGVPVVNLSARSQVGGLPRADPALWPSRI